MNRWMQLLARLSHTDENPVENESGSGSLTDDELNELWSGLGEETDTIVALAAESPGDKDIAAAFKELADATEATKSVIDERAAERAEVEQQAAEQRARIAALRGEPVEDETPEPETPADEDTETPAEADTPAADEPETPTATEEVPEPVAAAAPIRIAALDSLRRNRPARNAPIETPDTPDDDRRLRIVAAAGLSSHNGGAEMDFDDVGGALVDAWLAGRGSSERSSVRVASIFTPAERSDSKLGGAGEGADTLQTILASARSRGTVGDAAIAPITAAGGLCGPPEVIYDWPSIGNARTPVGDSLPRMPATRGQVQYPTPYSWIDVEGVSNGVVNDWTLQNDIDSVGSSPRKVVARVLCPTWVTAHVDAIYSQIEFGNFAQRFNPLVNDNFMREVPKVVARHMEALFLTQIAAASAAGAGLGSTGRLFDYTDSSGGTVLGTGRDLKAVLSILGEHYRSYYRMNVDDPLTLIAPQWILRAIQEDMMRQIPGDDEFMASLDEYRREVFDNANVNVIFSPDLDRLQSAYPWTPGDGGATGSPPVSHAKIVKFPAAADFYLFPADTFTVLDGGQMDLGVIRDSALVAKNDFLIFSEWWQTVIQTGFASWSIKVPVVPQGRTSATTSVSAPNY